MRNMLDFSSLHGLLSTLIGLVLVSLVAVGIRLLFMHVVQRRRERENRQVNERLKVLIAAYKTLGGTFTGDLTVDPSHLRDQRARGADAADDVRPDAAAGAAPGSERRRRVRDAVEAALSDVILLGTEEQVRLAAQAATDMAAGRRVETAALVVSLRRFVREVLELEPIPAQVSIPSQGPLRTGGGGNAARGAAGARGGGGGGSGGGAGAGGAGLSGLGATAHRDDPDAH
jgi:uncharacterized membrane protein YgcG